MFSRNNRDLFGSSADHALLKANKLDRFDVLWNTKADWVEPPNYRRRGWSGVCRIKLHTSTGAGIGVYLKRQEGHCYRDTVPPFRRRPTAYREYRTLLKMKAHAIAAPDVIYYGERRLGRVWQAILMTREIPQNISLDDYLRQSPGRPHSEVTCVLRETAALAARFHGCHWEHGALYGKHVVIGGMAPNAPDSPQADRKPFPCLIDLEKARFRLFRWRIALHDLTQLYRHTAWDVPDWQLFLDHYTAEIRKPWLGSILNGMICRKAQGKHGRSTLRRIGPPQTLAAWRPNKAIGKENLPIGIGIAS